MIRATILAACLASAAAFAPSAGFSSRTMVRSSRAVGGLKMQSELSTSIPFMKRPARLDGTLPGDVGFDPLGFTDIFDPKVMFEAEIKHCRLAMLAFLGFIVQDAYTLPFYPKLSPLDAHDFVVTQGGGQQIIFWMSFLEVFGLIGLFETLQGKRFPGDFAFDPLNLAKDEKTLERYRLAEVKNGRLAMMAVGGIVHQYLLTKQTALEQLSNFKAI